MTRAKSAQSSSTSVWKTASISQQKISHARYGYLNSRCASASGGGGSIMYDTSFSTTGRVLRLVERREGERRGEKVRGCVTRARGRRGKVSTVAIGDGGEGVHRRGWISEGGRVANVGRRDASSVFLSFLGSRVAGRGSDLGRASGNALVDESAVQGLALLDHVVLLEEFLEGETLLVEHELRVGKRAGWKNKSDGSAEARGPSRQRPTGGARGPAGAVGDRPRWVLTRRQRRKTPRDASRVAIRVTATTPRRRPRQGRVVRASGEKCQKRSRTGACHARRARRARQIAPRVRASRRAPRQGKSAPVPEISRTSCHARANGRLSGASRSGANRDRANRDCPQRRGARSRSRIPRSTSTGTRDREPARFIAALACNGHFQTERGRISFL